MKKIKLKKLNRDNSNYLNDKGIEAANSCELYIEFHSEITSQEEFNDAYEEGLFEYVPTKNKELWEEIYNELTSIARSFFITLDALDDTEYVSQAKEYFKENNYAS